MHELSFCRFCDGLNFELTKLSEKMVWRRKKSKMSFLITWHQWLCRLCAYIWVCMSVCMYVYVFFDCLLAFVFAFFILSQWNTECINWYPTGIFLCKHTTSDSQSGKLSDCLDSLRCTKLNEKDSDKDKPILVGMAVYTFVKIFIHIQEKKLLHKD